MRHTFIFLAALLLLGCEYHHPAPEEKISNGVTEELTVTDGAATIEERAPMIVEMPPPVMAPPAPTAPVRPPAAEMPRLGDRGPSSVPVPPVPQSDDILDQLRSASIAFDVPEVASIQDTISANLLVSLEASVDDLLQELGGVHAFGAEIVVSRIVVATLVAPEFEIFPITPERQVLSMLGTTRWEWDLKPKSAGTHRVRLSVTAVVTVDGDRAEHHLRTFSQDVTVTVTKTAIVLQWLGDHWQWLFAFLLYPLLRHLWKKWRARRLSVPR